MDPSVVEHMRYLQENVAELHRLGREWGMSDEEISSCLDRALKEDDNIPVSQSPMAVARKIWHWARFVMKMFTGLVVFLIFAAISLNFLFFVYPPAEHYVSGKLQPYGYAIFRYVRLATLPLHNYFNITSYYDAECLMDNPWFREPTFECNWCENVNNIEVMNDTEDQDLILQYLTQARPVIFKSLSEQVKFEDLRQMYKENRGMLDNSVYIFQSSIQGMNTIQDLFKDDVNEDTLIAEGTTLHWQTKNMAGSQVIRKLFPRPSFVPAASEVSLDKVVFIDGPKSDHYELASAMMQISFYVQGSGKRKIILAPLKHCRSYCSPMQLMMTEGDIFMYNPAIWKAVVMPNVQGVSIGFLGSFNAPFAQNMPLSKEEL